MPHIRPSHHIHLIIAHVDKGMVMSNEKANFMVSLTHLAIGCASGINYSVLFICATYKSLQLLDPSLWGYAISEALE